MKARVLSHVLAFAALATMPILSAKAQCLDWRAFPYSSPEIGGNVSTLVVHDDGAGPLLYVGGSLTLGNSSVQQGVLRWDGTRFNALGSGAGGPVVGFVFFDDGSGPALFAVMGYPSNSVLKWDGVAWQQISVALINSAVAIDVFDDGSGPALFVTDYRYLRKWNGTTWSQFDLLPNYIIGDLVLCTGSYDDGSGPALFFGGVFNGPTSLGSHNILKWQNGVLSGVGGGTGGEVRTLDAWDDGSGPALFVGGTFTTPVPHLARWDGTAWSQVGTGLATLPTGVAVLDDGGGPKLFVGSTLYYTPSLDPPHIDRWDGSNWSAIPTPPGADCFSSGFNAKAFEMFDEGMGAHLFVGAKIGSLGQVLGGLTRRNSTAWERVGATPKGLNQQVRQVTVQDDGSGPALYAVGNFCHVDGELSSSVARLDGDSWHGLGDAFVAYQPAALTTFNAGAGPQITLTATGQSGSSNGAQLKQWDGMQWTPLGPVSSHSTDAYLSLEVFSGDLYVGGSFSTPALGVNSPNLTRWRPGIGYQIVGNFPTPGVNGDVNAMTKYDDGSGPALYVCGSFTVANGGLFVNHIARWNGSNFSTLGLGTNGLVDALTGFDDGSGPALYAAGTFTTAGGMPASCVAKWNGTSWSALGAGLNAQVLSLEVFDDGSGPALYAGGNFSASGNVPMQRIARWNGTSWSAVGGNIDGTVWTLKSFDDGTGVGPQLFAGGVFHHAGTLPSENFAAWRGCGGAISKFCFGDGSIGACPCGNAGLSGRGCDNAVHTGGARLNATGTTNPDTIVLHAGGELPNAPTLVFQGSSALSQPSLFGDGLRCVGGNLKRLFTTSAVGGAINVPDATQMSISARSAALGDPLVPGSVRSYQAWYRDPNLSFCAPPSGDAWNLSNAVRIVW